MEANQHEVFISFSFKDQVIVDKIVNHLTNLYHIPCWICTEKIRAGENFRDDIVEAIDSCSIIVFVQSKMSAISQEVSDEVLYGLSVGKMVMPFKIEESVLKPAMRMKFHSTHYIDATKPTLDERIRELAKDICRFLGRTLKDIDTGEAAPKEKLLSTPSVIPKKVFCGREDVLDEISRRFHGEDRIVFLQGIGGIGKTQIAKQYAKLHKSDYDTVIYATYRGSIKETILSDAAFCFEPEMIRYTLSDGTREDDDAFFDRKLSKIKKLSNARTLIILDNFDVDSDPKLPMLMDGNYHLLITTRCDYSRYYSTIKIYAIDSMDSLKNIFLQNYDGFDVQEDDPSLEELIELVNRHTYTIELLAQHMENSGQTVSEMIQALKEEGILSLNEEVRNADMETRVAYENLLKMFKMFSLSEEELRILCYLSFMPTDGVGIKDLKDWANITSTKTVKKLESASWIIKNGDFLGLHPIIRDVVRHEIPVQQEQFEDFIARFCCTIREGNAWHFRKTQKDHYGSIAKNLIACFTEITEKTEALYFHTEALLSFAVDPEYAVKLAKELYDYFGKKYGNRSYEAARAAYKLGWAYAYNSHLPDATEQARLWLSKANSIFETLELHTSDEIAAHTQTTVNLAKVYGLIYRHSQDPADYALAKQYAEGTIERTTRAFLPGDPHYAKIAGAHWQLSDVLVEHKQYEEALVEIETALSILVSLYTLNNADSMGALHRKANVLFSLGRYAEARELAEQSAKGYAEFFGAVHPRVCGIYELLGDACLALNLPEDAQSAYRQAGDIAEKIYSPDAEQRRTIAEKLRKNQ